MTRSGLKRGGGAGGSAGAADAPAEDSNKRAKADPAAAAAAAADDPQEEAAAAAPVEADGTAEKPEGQPKAGGDDEEDEQPQDVAVAVAVAVALDAAAEPAKDVGDQQQQPAASSASASHNVLPTKANKARSQHGGGSSLRSQAYQQQQQFNADQMLANFDHYLFQLLAFKVETGNFHVPKEHELHTWLQFLKREFKSHCTSKSSLTDEQIKVLEFLHVPLTSRGEEHWNRFYELLRQYQQMHGHVLVPRLCEIPGLGDWVTDQRRQYKSWKQGQQSQLTQERREKLEQLGFAWQVRNRPEWDMRFQQLLEYRDKHGDCKVPQHYKENKALGKWTAKQREQYKLYKKGQHSFLTPYRLEKLNQIGFVWQVRSGNDGEEDPLDEGKEAAHEEAAAVGGAVKVEGDAAVAAAAAAAAAVGGTGAMKDPPPAAAAMGQKNDHDALVAEAAALAAAEVKTEEAIITANV